MDVDDDRLFFFKRKAVDYSDDLSNRHKIKYSR